MRRQHFINNKSITKSIIFKVHFEAISQQNLSQFQVELQAKQEEFEMEKSTKISLQTQIDENYVQFQATNDNLKQQIETLIGDLQQSQSDNITLNAFMEEKNTEIASKNAARIATLEESIGKQMVKKIIELYGSY